MTEFYGHHKITNPNWKEDAKYYFFNSIPDSNIEEKLIKNEKFISLICNRYELILKLLDLKEIFETKQTFVEHWENNKDFDAIEVIRDSKLSFEGKEFNGIPWDLEALCQYLLLTIIDTITGEIDHKNFTKWLFEKSDRKSYTKEGLLKYQEEYDNENGLRKNFIRAFSILSKDLKSRIINTFCIAEIDLGRINTETYEEWEKLNEDEKYIKLVKYFYDDIRCKYTHSATRTFLNCVNINVCYPSNKKVLINTVSPEKDSLILILQDVVKELMIKKVIIGDCI